MSDQTGIWDVWTENMGEKPKLLDIFLDILAPYGVATLVYVVEITDMCV